MASEANIMVGVKSMVDFIQNKTVSNIVQASNEKLIEMDQQTLEKITRLIESSIQSAFILSSSEVTNRIKQ